MGILVTPGGAVTLPGLLLIIGVPLLAIGQYKVSSDSASSVSLFGKPLQLVIGTSCIAMGLAILMVGFVAESRADDREDLKYEAQRAEDILCEIKSVASRQDKDSSTNSVKCLNALAMKCGKEHARRKRQAAAPSEERAGAHNGWSDIMFAYKPHELELLCQEAAYIVLGLQPNDDDALSSALSLLAVVAGDNEVRRRNIEEADRFGLNRPVKAMRSALTRAKADDSPEEKEHASAELQRKGCLLLGALSNEDKGLATKVVDEEGLIAVLDAVEWYRFHEEVANWGLWCVFVLCFDHLGNKGELIKLDGVNKICRAMKDNPKSLEVARHGIAVLFDMMREMPESVHDVSQIRTIALNAGMHDVVKKALDEFPESKEIRMMGQQMLVATGYQGDIL